MYHIDNPFNVPPIFHADGRPEAEFLADRVGIMVQGSIRYTGTATQLKQAYGGGYKITVSCTSASGRVQINE